MTSGDWVTHLATYVGASGPAFRLLISLLLAYPFAFFHRQFLYKRTPILQHIYFIIAGTFLGYFSYGWAVLHAYACIATQYLVIALFSAHTGSVVFSFVFQMSYLIGAYIVTETAIYDIQWTIPHCVLSLRLIGQAFDTHDGTKDAGSLSGDQRKCALTSTPSLWEVAGHAFYPGSYMIGPQFPMKRYLNFVNGNFSNDASAPRSVAPGLKRLLQGLLYVGVYQIGSQVVNNEYITSPEYYNLQFWQRLVVIGIYGKVLLYKYVSCWMVAEGACIVAGISHNGKNSKGEELWDGCENVNISVFEKSYKFSHIIASFNKQTNQWIAQYVYKRLKFVGNRYVSQGAALLFLAIWHGLHSGYYVCFFMEFIVMKMEKDLTTMLSKNSTIQKWHMSAVGFWVDVVVVKVLVTIFFGFCTLPFGLLKLRIWWKAYKDLYFVGCLIFGLWPVYAPLIKVLLRSNSDHIKLKKENLDSSRGKSE